MRDGERLLRVGEIVSMPIYNDRRERCEVLAIRPHGTIDVEVLRTGKCYRLSGLRGYVRYAS